MAIPGFGEELYYQDFSTGSWPTGYAFEGNWQIGNNWDGNDSPPAAIYNWSPRQINFEHNMTTDYIDVEDNDELHNILMKLPLLPYLEMEVTALSKHPSSIKYQQELLSIFASAL